MVSGPSGLEGRPTAQQKTPLPDPGAGFLILRSDRRALGRARSLPGGMTGHNNRHAERADEAARRARGADVEAAVLDGAKQRHGHLLGVAIHEGVVGVTGRAFVKPRCVALCRTQIERRLNMTETVTLRDASRRFARLIRQVDSGAEFVVTRNGAPVARLTPVSGTPSFILS